MKLEVQRTYLILIYLMHWISKNMNSVGFVFAYKDKVISLL